MGRHACTSVLVRGRVRGRGRVRVRGRGTASTCSSVFVRDCWPDLILALMPLTW